MTIKQEYERMKSELRDWNNRSSWDDTKYCYHIERWTKKAKTMFLEHLNKDFEKMNFDMKYGFITAEQYNKLWKVWNDCSRSIERIEIM